MKLEVFNHPDRGTAERLDRIENQFRLIRIYLERLLMSYADLKAIQDDTSAKVDAIQAHIQILNDQVAAAAANSAALAEAVAQAQAINDKLAGIGG